MSDHATNKRRNIARALELLTMHLRSDVTAEPNMPFDNRNTVVGVEIPPGCRSELDDLLPELDPSDKTPKDILAQLFGIIRDELLR